MAGRRAAKPPVRLRWTTGHRARQEGALTTSRYDDPAGPQPGSRRAKGALLAALLTLLVVAVPAAVSAWLALLSFSGCLIECGAPDPGAGTMWAAIAVLLLALPVAVGVLIARGGLRRAAPWLAGLAGAFAVVALLAQRVV